MLWVDLLFDQSLVVLLVGSWLVLTKYICFESPDVFATLRITEVKFP